MKDFIIKCKNCDTKVDAVYEIRTCQRILWCEKCRLNETIYKLDDDTFNRFYKVEIEDEKRNP